MAGQIERIALDRWDEPREREDAGRRWPARRQAERERHHGALREPADHRALERHADLLGEPIDERGGLLEALSERGRVRKADALDEIPVRAARRQRERATREDADEPPLGVERVEQRLQIVLVAAASVEQYKSSLGLSGRRAQRGRERHRGGTVSGVRAGSMRLRRCSNAGGSESRSPSASADSSAAKPGPFEANSKSTPFGSRA